MSPTVQLLNLNGPVPIGLRSQASGSSSWAWAIMPNRPLPNRCESILWEDFSKHLDLVRRQVGLDAGREMRARRYEASKRWFETAVERDGVDPASVEGGRLVRLALTLTSSLAFLDLHDRQGSSAAQAAEDVAWAIGALTDRSRAAPPKDRTKKQRSA